MQKHGSQEGQSTAQETRRLPVVGIQVERGHHSECKKEAGKRSLSERELVKKHQSISSDQKDCDEGNGVRAVSVFQRNHGAPAPVILWSTQLEDQRKSTYPKHTLCKRSEENGTASNGTVRALIEKRFTPLAMSRIIFSGRLSIHLRVGCCKEHHEAARRQNRTNTPANSTPGILSGYLQVRRNPACISEPCSSAFIPGSL